MLDRLKEEAVRELRDRFWSAMGAAGIQSSFRKLPISAIRLALSEPETRIANVADILNYSETELRKRLGIGKQAVKVLTQLKEYLLRRQQVMKELGNAPFRITVEIPAWQAAHLKLMGPETLAESVKAILDEHISKDPFEPTPGMDAYLLELEKKANLHSSSKTY